MVITLHNLAQTYNLLPSEALTRATTFDLYVLDTYYRYGKYQEAKAQGKATPSTSLTQDEMKQMLARVRGQAQGA
jgi:hypothetical protein